MTACGKKVTLTGSSIWSADCQSIAGSHFLQTGEYFSGKENLKAEKKKVELFGLLLFLRFCCNFENCVDRIGRISFSNRYSKSAAKVKRSDLQMRSAEI